MPKRRVIQVGRLNHGERLQIESFGRKGAGQRTPRLSPEQVGRASRTVRRVPEVVVKVSGGGRDNGAVKAHISYIDRHGKLPIETEGGSKLPDRRVAKELVQGWGLDARPGRRALPPPRGTRPKVVHNLVLSMPAKVDPEKVLAAARKFARENFAFVHRYAMVLHTDTKHPHVHLVVKAAREDGAGRLNIYKATLREWREQFAQYLREQGVEANATPAALRGRPRAQLRDPIFRAARRGVSNPVAADEADRRSHPLPGSTFLAKRAQEAIAALEQRGATETELGAHLRSLRTGRAGVLRQWAQTADRLDAQGERELAQAVRQFAASMPRAVTDRQRMVDAVAHALRRDRAEPKTPDVSKPRGQKVERNR